MACPLAQSLLHRVTKPWLPMEKPRIYPGTVGDRTKHQAFTLANRDHMRDLLATAFKQRHFDDGLLQVATYYGNTLQANLGEPGTGSRPSVAPAPGWRPSMPAPQESPPSTPQVNRLWASRTDILHTSSRHSPLRR